MQATAINNLKKAKGVDVSKDSTPQGPGKGDLLQVCGGLMWNTSPKLMHEIVLYEVH